MCVCVCVCVCVFWMTINRFDNYIVSRFTLQIMKREGLTPQSPLDQLEHALRQHQNQGDINDLFNHKYVKCCSHSAIATAIYFSHLTGSTGFSFVVVIASCEQPLTRHAVHAIRHELYLYSSVHWYTIRPISSLR